MRRRLVVADWVIIWGVSCLASMSSAMRAEAAMPAPVYGSAGATEYDYIMVCGTPFLADAQALVDYRSNQGFKVALYDVAAVGPTVTDLQAFVGSALTAWSIRPRYLLLIGDADEQNATLDFVPTYYVPNPYEAQGVPYPNYAFDWWIAMAADSMPQMQVGRLPVGSPQELANYVAKVSAYESVDPYAVSWTQSMLFLTGDSGQFAGVPWRNLHNNTMSAFANPLASLGVQYTSLSAYAGDDESTVRPIWDGGLGLVCAYGNVGTSGWQTILVDILHFPFAASLAATGLTPIVIAGSCGSGQFPNFEGILPEDMLFTDGAKGAVGVLAPSHTVRADEVYRIYERSVDAVLGRDVRSLGAAWLESIEEYEAAGEGQSYIPQSWTLFGEPALRIRLQKFWPNHSWDPVPPFRQGFELTDTHFFQNDVVKATGASSGSGHFAVHSASAEGECLYWFDGHDPGNALADTVELRLCDLGDVRDPSGYKLGLGGNTVLTYLVRADWDNGGDGASRVVVSGETSAGTLGAYGLVDQDGIPLDGASRPTLPVGEWRRVYVDLTDAAPYGSNHLTQLTLHYDGAPQDSGTFRTFIDDVRVFRVDGNGDGQEVIDGDCSEDVDRDGIPDFWFPILGDAGSPSEVVGIVSDVLESGNRCMSLSASPSGVVRGVYQGVHVYSDDPSFEFTFDARGSGQGGAVRVVVTETGSGLVVVDDVLALGATWDTYAYVFGGFRRWGRDGLLRVEFEPQSFGDIVLIDDVSIKPYALSLTEPTVQPSAVVAAKVFPSPLRRLADGTLRLTLQRDERVSVKVYNAAGRLVATQEPRLLEGGRPVDLALSNLRLVGDTLAAGVLFVEAVAEGGTVGRAKVVVR